MNTKIRRVVKYPMVGCRRGPYTRHCRRHWTVTMINRKIVDIYCYSVRAHRRPTFNASNGLFFIFIFIVLPSSSTAVVGYGPSHFNSLWIEGTHTCAQSLYDKGNGAGDMGVVSTDVVGARLGIRSETTWQFGQVRSEN